MRALKDYRGKWMVLYFYPKDDTPGCTKEACGFRDGYKEYAKRGIAVLGVSVDSVASHKKFAEKYHLNFPILADEKKAVVQKYGVWQEKNIIGSKILTKEVRKYMGTVRTTFLINPKGKIVKVYASVKPDLHAPQILGDFTKLEKKA